MHSYMNNKMIDFVLDFTKYNVTWTVIGVIHLDTREWLIKPTSKTIK